MRRHVVLVIFALLFLLIGCSEQAKEDNQPVDQQINDTHSASVSESVSQAKRSKEHTPVFPRSPAPSHLHVYNCYGDPYEERMLLVSLQGIVAKTDPRIYLIYYEEVDTFWLDEMADDYSVTNETAAGTWALMDEFASEASGVIVYDPDLPSTVNLAATLAGINNALVVAPSLLAQVQNDYGLSVLFDLRGQFTDRVTMYQWAMVNVWPQADDGDHINRSRVNDKDASIYVAGPVEHTLDRKTDLDIWRDISIVFIRIGITSLCAAGAGHQHSNEQNDDKNLFGFHAHLINHLGTQ